MKYFKDYFENVHYKDDFGYHSGWNQEIDSWLCLLYELDPVRYEKYKKRVVIEDERDAFLAEMKAVYYFKEKLGVTIVKLEPLGKDNFTLDFEFIDIDGKSWLTEVKRPSWRKEVMGDEDMTLQEKLKRLKKPQHINAEARWYSDRDAVDDPIRKAIPKFIKARNNLLGSRVL